MLLGFIVIIPSQSLATGGNGGISSSSSGSSQPPECNASSKSVCSAHCGSATTTSTLSGILSLPKSKHLAGRGRVQMQKHNVSQILKEKGKEKERKEEEKRARQLEK